MPDLALQLIAENKKTKNPYLDLGNCSLTELPVELLDCVWLETLVLSGIWEEYDVLDGQKRIEKISVNKGKPNRIAQLLPDFTRLSQLKKLIASGGGSQVPLSDLSSLKDLLHLEYLDISQTPISDLSTLKDLPNLIYLNAAKTQVKELLPISQLINLRSLYLGDTMVTHLSSLKNLRCLRHLDVSAEKVDDLSPLAELHNLQSLNVSWTLVSNLAPLQKMLNLQLLNASYTEVGDLEPLGALSQLQEVDFTGTKISNLSPLAKCQNLQQLGLASTQINDLSSLKGLHNLLSLSLASTNIRDLSPLKSLLKLQKLNVSRTQVNDISPLANLHALQELNTSETQVSDLSPIVFLIEKSVKGNPYGSISLNYYNCPLSTPPPEIVAQGIKSVLNYFYELRKSGKEKGLEAKILLIGESQSGKTSLCVRLLKGTKVRLPKQEDRTLGLKVIVEPLEIKLQNRKKLRLNIFDFGGQTYYKPLHQFFYSHRALYVLVSRNGDDSNQFDYWFETAHLFGGGSPLLVVNNLFSNTPCGFNRSHYFSTYAIIKDSLDINLKECERDRLDHIKKRIRELAEELQWVNHSIPQTWAGARREIEAFRHRNIISIEEFFAICAKPENGQMERDIANNCLAYLHDIGVCLHYQNIDGLKNYIIVEHEWATKAVYRVLEDRKVIENKGLFTLEDLRRIWQQSTERVSNDGNFQFEKYLLELLELMKYFKLCYPVHLNGNEFIAPSLLPVLKNSDDLNWIPDNDLQFEVEYNYMPLGLFSRFIAGNYKKIDGTSTRKLVWRDEVFFQWKRTQAYVCREFREGKKAIVFRVKGSDLEERKQMLTLLRNVLEELHAETPGIMAEEKVPCICEVCSLSDKPHFYRYSQLKIRKERNKKTIECDHPPFDKVSVDALLGNIFSEIKPNGDKGSTSEKRPLKAFVSYSKHDEEYLKQFKKHLTSLRHDNYIELWDDTEIRPGEEWDESIKGALNKAEIIFFLVSADLLAADYIWEKEIPEAIQRHEASGSIVIPIKIKSCDCKGLPIDRYLGLPRKGGFIANTSNDALWTEVAQEIRALVDEFWKGKLHF